MAGGGGGGGPAVAHGPSLFLPVGSASALTMAPLQATTAAMEPAALPVPFAWPAQQQLQPQHRAAAAAAAAPTPMTPSLQMLLDDSGGSDADLRALFDEFREDPDFMSDMAAAGVDAADHPPAHLVGATNTTLPQPAAAHTARDSGDSDDDGDYKGLLELGVVADPGGALIPQAPLQAAEAEAAALQHLLLKVAAGMYGNNSRQMLIRELQPRLARYNAAQLAAGHAGLMVHDLGEGWFLQRSVLHLLVSTVRVWGIAGDERPAGTLCDEERLQLLQSMCGSGGSTTLKALLDRRNRNRATPWFTAAHFCNLSALEWLISRQELDLKRMLQCTKRGKLFYHITSTQAAQPDISPLDRQRLRQGLVLMLTALANRLQRWLDRKTPEQQQRLRDEVMLRRQRRRQRQQTRLEGRGYASALTPGVSGQVAGLATTTGLSHSSVAASAPPTGAPGSMQQLAGLVTRDVAKVTAGSVLNPASTARNGGGGTGRGSLECSDDVLWWLKHYAIFHTEWHSSRRASPYRPSPEYDGGLLEEVVVDLFGFHPRGHGE